MVYLDPGIIASMPGDPATSSAPRLELTRPVIQDGRLSRTLRRLFARLEHWSAASAPTSAEALACEESLVESCAQLLERHSTTPPPRETGGEVKQVREWLADDLLHPPTLSDMATMAGLSRYQLLRRFEKAYGVPPHAWLLLQRAERARVLIRNGMALAQAAAACGFADQSHMTRIFVRKFGFTPGDWRKSSAKHRLQ
jgi:AraC-like DNA-binding protein